MAGGWTAAHHSMQRIRARPRRIRKRFARAGGNGPHRPGQIQRLYESSSICNRLLVGTRAVIENFGWSESSDCAALVIGLNRGNARVIKESLLRRRAHCDSTHREPNRTLRLRRRRSSREKKKKGESVHHLARAKGQRARRAIGTRVSPGVKEAAKLGDAKLGALARCSLNVHFRTAHEIARSVMLRHLLAKIGRLRTRDVRGLL